MSSRIFRVIFYFCRNRTKRVKFENDFLKKKLQKKGFFKKSWGNIWWSGERSGIPILDPGIQNPWLNGTWNLGLITHLTLTLNLYTSSIIQYPWSINESMSSCRKCNVFFLKKASPYLCNANLFLNLIWTLHLTPDPILNSCSTPKNYILYTLISPGPSAKYWNRELIPISHKESAFKLSIPWFSRSFCLEFKAT